MTNTQIKKAESPEQMRAAFRLVNALLAELGEEGDESGEVTLESQAANLAEIGDRHIILLAYAEDIQPAGVLTLSECYAIYANGQYGVINEMYVVPDSRSDGIGAKLVASAVEYGRARGWRRIDVTAPESSRWERTRRFYEKLGFVFTGPKLKLLL